MIFSDLTTVLLWKKIPLNWIEGFFLSFRISKHFLVPRHEVLTKEESEQFLKENNFAIEKLPKISRLDPVVQEINGKRGDIIRVFRNSPTAGRTLFYRIVF